VVRRKLAVSSGFVKKKGTLQEGRGERERERERDFLELALSGKPRLDGFFLGRTGRSRSRQVLG
jgi:hypothetical protein